MKSNYQLKNVLENNIKSKYMNDVNGLSMHYLESGEKTKTSELIVLLHGFPELSYSWRKILPVLSEQGFHVIAPDQRGYSPNARPSSLKEYKIYKLSQDVIDIANAFNFKKFHLKYSTKISLYIFCKFF